jgi:ElaB/YqjD/DUF883 family membrane-anchored ribosome-binding protein
MLLDSKTIKTTAATDVDALMAQLSALREEVSSLAHSVSSTAERRGRRMASDISDGMGEAAHYVERKGRTAEADLEKSIATHPLLALGLAAVAGLLIGALTRR